MSKKKLSSRGLLYITLTNIVLVHLLLLGSSEQIYKSYVDCNKTQGTSLPVHREIFNAKRKRTFIKALTNATSRVYLGRDVCGTDLTEETGNRKSEICTQDWFSTLTWYFHPGININEQLQGCWADARRSSVAAWLHAPPWQEERLFCSASRFLLKRWMPMKTLPTPAGGDNEMCMWTPSLI